MTKTVKRKILTGVFLALIAGFIVLMCIFYDPESAMGSLADAGIETSTDSY